MLNPVPAVMVSAGREKPNIITIAWTGIVNTNPPMTYISVRPERYSHDIIESEGEFVVNLVGQCIDFLQIRVHLGDIVIQITGNHTRYLVKYIVDR